MYAFIHESRAILQVHVMIPKRFSDFSKLTSKVINYCEACASLYFRYYVNYLSFDLLLNCSYNLCTLARIPWVLFAMACQYGKTFFSIHIERALNHDEMLRDTLNCSISKYQTNIYQIRHYSESFCNDVMKIGLVRKKKCKEIRTFSSTREHARSLISNNTLVTNFPLILVLSFSRD